MRTAAGKALCAALCIAFLTLARPDRAGALSRQFVAMDTVMVVSSDEADEGLLADCEAEALRWEKLLSVTDPESEIYALNQSGEADLSPEVLGLLDSALALCGETDGALDVTVYPIVRAWGFTTDSYRVPGDAEISRLLEQVNWRRVAVDGRRVTLPEGFMVDLGAVAKGDLGDRLAGLLRTRGVRSAILSLGGNIVCLGEKPDGSAWRVGVRDPDDPDGLVGVVSVRNASVVTSGSYERYFLGEDGTVYGHIFDPSTGRPAQSGLVSVTVVGADGLRCDALSTALTVMGPEKARVWLSARPDVQALLVDAEGRLWKTASLGEGFQAQGKYTFSEIHVIG